MPKSRLQRQKLVDTWLHSHFPEVGLDAVPHDMQWLSHIPFWCGDRKIHLKKPDTYMNRQCCTNHVLGLPEHPNTHKPQPLTPYQIELYDATSKHYTKMMPSRPRKYHLNKGRQMGFTEIVLRIMIHNITHHYEDSNIGIMAGTNGNLARKNLRRMRRMMRHVPEMIHDANRDVLQLWNGSVVEAFAANEEAMTGDTRYKAILLDELAKWRLVDDTPVYNSVMPIINTNVADLWAVSTPKGPIKTFYKIHKEPKDFVKFRFPIWRAQGNLFTKRQITDMLKNSVEDPNQEYLCEFTVSQDSIFGTVDEAERGKNWSEWDVEIDDEDDNYVEGPEWDESE